MNFVPGDLRRGSTWRWAVAAGAVLLLTTTACSSSGGAKSSGGATSQSAASTSAASTQPSSSAALHDELPDSIKSSGVVHVAAQMDYPPQQFYAADNKTPEGISVDIADALGKVLDVKFEFTNTSFDSIIPGLLAKRYDTAITAMSATPERAKQVAFVVYLNTGTTLVVKAGNPDHINSVADLCGRTVGQIAGSSYRDQVAKISDEKCKGAGKPAITLQDFRSVAATYQAVITGRIAAVYKDFSANAYAVKNSHGQLEVVGDLIPDVPYGAAVNKNDPQLAKAMADALDQIIADGTYAAILKKWNVANAGVTKAKLIGVGS